MTIRGYVESFSLPEIFQIIDSGSKTGRLRFKVALTSQNPDLQGEFYLWFDKGNFVTITNSLKYQYLITLIQNDGWIDGRFLVKAKYSCPKDSSLGDYLQSENILSHEQLDSLFKMQLDILATLFNIDSAWFEFEEVDSSNKIPSDGSTFPLKEMTGKKKKASELSLEIMRNFIDWPRFADNFPSIDYGLQKIVSNYNLELTSLEQHLWNSANASVSLKNVAQKMAVSIEVIQQTALSMIFAGLIEEVPVQSPSLKAVSEQKFVEQSKQFELNGVATKRKVKSRASNSLVKSLVGFLRNNF